MNPTFQNLGSKKERRDTDPAAKGMGIDVRDGNASRLKGCVIMGRFATRAQGTKVVGVQKSYPKLFSEDDLAEELAGVLLPFTARAVKKATGVSLEAAKSWKKGRRFPHGSSLIRMASQFDTVDAWLRGKISRGGNVEFDSPEVSTAVVGELQKLALQDGPEGDAARKVLRNAMKGARR